MRKLLVICGPTATRKTKLTLHLAKKFDGELVSADSQQVYKYMDIGTGKDLTPRSKWHRAKFSIFNSQFSIGYYKIADIKVWGYDLVEPKEEFSVKDYAEIAHLIIGDILNRGKLPILVGGTGFYIKAVVDGIPTSSVPKNRLLRKNLKSKNLREQFELLAQMDPVRAASLNISDKKNPRRLVRAIEVAHAGIKNKQSFRQAKAVAKRLRQQESDVLFIGLSSSPAVLAGKIEKRIKKRLNEGIEKEIRELFKKGITFDHQSMQALGYKQWQGFFQDKQTRTEVVKKWLQAETQYAKRQMTWFKRDKRINWFDITEPRWRQNIEKKVQKWHNMADATKN